MLTFEGFEKIFGESQKENLSKSKPGTANNLNCQVGESKNEDSKPGVIKGIIRPASIRCTIPSSLSSNDPNKVEISKASDQETTEEGSKLSSNIDEQLLMISKSKLMKDLSLSTSSIPSTAKNSIRKPIVFPK